MRWRFGVAAGSLALASIGCGLAGYGPAVDQSRFVTVAENAGGLLLYSAHRLVYRPAAGLAAFPDGGVPQYVEDRSVIGIVTPSATSRILYAKANREWQGGQGELRIHSFVGPKAVIVESGQRRRDYLTEVRYYLLDVSNARLVALPLKRDLEARGRDVGYFYLLDGAGTLLFVTPPAGTTGRVDSTTNEIWLRKPSGDYALVARGADLYGRLPGELVYWDFAGRKLGVYEIASGVTHTIAKYIPAPETPPPTAVRVSNDGKALEQWRREDNTWQRVRTVLALDAALGGR